ncbi:cysteine--tRNA ligase [Sulfolobales archaeon HS-7]|nr:cysteine--tRNA ligase [Sulfolobales archaeon HS-7]
MRLYNTLGREKQQFVPITDGLVKMYVCGPTVQDSIHIGHGRTFTFFDALARYFISRGYTVFKVQNITDIDDKIINKANKEGSSWESVADRYTREYLEDISRLGIEVHAHPRVTYHINEIIDFITGLINKGHAYVAKSGSVYFDVDTFPEYGKLSNTQKEKWEQESEVLTEKKHPYDFALWKSSKPGEPYWESPWGRGRPGWHIECSVMSTKYLGERFDIHGGGMDLIFPHHENEIAQSESFFSHKWVNYWLHVSFLTINKDKMSKSLGNIIPLRYALEKYGASTLRYWFLSSHYRSTVDFSEENLTTASNALTRVRDAISLLRGIIKEGPKFSSSEDALNANRTLLSLSRKIDDALDDDFDTPLAVSYIHEVVSVIFSSIKKTEDFSSALLAYNILSKFNDVFGVLDADLKGGNEDMIKLIDSIVEIRNLLRKRKEYELSDEIRKILNNIGIAILDGKERTTWRFT